MSFKIQIEDLIGSVGDDTLITQSLLDAGSEIINVAPKNKLINSSFESSVSASGLAIDSKKILEVHKDSYIAKRVLYSDLGKYKDSNSIYYATATDPVYYTKDEKVYIVASGSLTNGYLVHIPKQPTTDGSTLIAHGSSSTQYFPLEAEHLMILGAAVKCLQRILSDKTSALPSDISGTLTMPSVPVSPVLASNSVTFTATAPVYTAPVSSPSFSIVDTFISTDEDIELAGAKIQEINAQIGEYQANIQNQLNVFNDANVEYQAELQKAIQDAQLAQSDDAQALQKYQAEVQNYSAQVNKAIQERNSDIQNFSAKLQKQVTDYQWKQGQYQMLNAEYNQGLQNFIGRTPDRKRN